MLRSFLKASQNKLAFFLSLAIFHATCQVAQASRDCPDTLPDTVHSSKVSFGAGRAPVAQEDAIAFTRRGKRHQLSRVVGAMLKAREL